MNYTQRRRLDALNEPKLHLLVADRMLACKGKRASRYTPNVETFRTSRNQCASCARRIGR